jgi:hypothetical protein
MIFFWYTRSEHNGIRTSLLVNPADIGLTAPSSNFRGPARRMQTDRRLEH